MLSLIVSTVVAVTVGQGTPRPAAILGDVRSVGAKTTLIELYRDETRWLVVLRGIAGGTSEWFAVAEALRPVSDGHQAEALDAAVGEALARNAGLILSRATGPFFLSAICGAPDVDDSRFDKYDKAVAELNRRIRGVERTSDPALATLRNDCLSALRQSERELRRFFGAAAR
jgi:hypothetical protein